MKNKIQCSKREKENNSRSNNKKIVLVSKVEKTIEYKAKKTDTEI